MSRLNMRGSVAGFVVVGIVLAALVLGSIYVVKTQLAGELQGDNTQVALNQAEEATDDAANGDTDKNESDVTNNETVESEAVEEVAEAGVEEQPEIEEQPVDSADYDEDDTIPATGVASPQVVDELPETGPAETLATILALGVLAGFVAVYRRSVRAKA